MIPRITVMAAGMPNASEAAMGSLVRNLMTLFVNISRRFRSKLSETNNVHEMTVSRRK